MRKCIPYLALSVLLQCFFSAVIAGEIDATTVVDQIIDGETFNTTTMGIVRLADIDAPEIGESGYEVAKILLTYAINKRTVCLDIDDMYETDLYDRLVCVVYVEYNLTHYTNVNKALLEYDVAVIENYDNEFNPYTWTLYVLKEVIPEFPSFLILPVLMLATLLTIIIRVLFKYSLVN